MIRPTKFLPVYALVFATFLFGFGFLLVPLASAITGLDFPGTAVKTIRFRFSNPQNNGLPIYGPSGNGVTYIWRAYPRQKAGYYTTFFWGNDGNFWWDSGRPNTYYGAHPYPQPAPNGTNHKWEIATDFGGDYLSNEYVAYNRWYTQALRVWSDGSGKHADFYWDLPDTSKRVSVTVSGSFGNQNPPSPALTFGDAPWNEGHEVYNGIIRGIQVYSGLLSISDMLSEVSSPLSTSAGASKIWYLNMNPTPSDISDKSGRGHNPSWVGSERPGLYTDGQLTPPAAPSNLILQ